MMGTALHGTGRRRGGWQSGFALGEERSGKVGDTTMQRGDVASEGWPLAIVWECCEGGPPDQLEIG